MAKQFSDENFQTEVIEASKDKPVLVDFFASWCGPCKMQAPVVDQLAEEMEGQAIVGKLNTEEAPSSAAQYGVMSIPTLIVFKDGKPAETMVGLQSKEGLAQVLKKYI